MLLRNLIGGEGIPSLRAGEGPSLTSSFQDDKKQAVWNAVSRNIKEGKRSSGKTMVRRLKEGMGADLLIYGIRCIIGFLIGYKLYLAFPEYELYWTIISILLVISPEGKDSRRLTVERVKANLIGSSVGLLCFMLPAPEVVLMVLGIVLSIIICYLFDLMNVARTAVVALIIVVFHEQETMTPFAAIERFVSVTLGCLIGLAVTTATAYVIRFMKRRVRPKVK